MQGEQPPNHPPANKLVLPSSDEASSSPEQFTQRAQTLPQHRVTAPTRPTSLINSANPIHTDSPRLSRASIPAMPRVAPPVRGKMDWRKDPAYKFLFIAIAVVLLASILFVAFAGSSISSLFSQSGAGAGTTQTAPGGGVPAQGTVDTNPTFPTPSGNRGITPTNQPTTNTPTATLPSPTATTAPNPTPTIAPSPTPTQNPQLTLQLVNVPNQVNNNTTVTINVTASQPGVQVELTITYNTNPFLKTLGPQTTDNNGNAAFQWSVQVHPSGHSQVFARIVAIARNKNGQLVTSQAVTVKIVVHGVIVGG